MKSANQIKSSATILKTPNVVDLGEAKIEEAGGGKGGWDWDAFQVPSHESRYVPPDEPPKLSREQARRVIRLTQGVLGRAAMIRA